MIGFIAIGSSVIEGVGGSVLWVAQGKYMSDCIKICPEKAGLMTSIFWTIGSAS